MFVPPEERRPWHPPPPEGRGSRPAESVLLFLIGLFLLAVFLAPIGGSGLVDAFLALVRR